MTGSSHNCENGDRQCPVENAATVSFFAPAVSTLWKQIESYKLDPRALFQEAGIDPGLMFDGSARIPRAQIEDLTDRVVSLTGDDLFGIRQADYFRPSHLGALGFAWLASPTLRMALERLSRYARVINEQLTVSLSEDLDQFRVDVAVTFPVKHEHIRDQAQMALLAKTTRIIAGQDLNPARVRFKHAEPADTSYYYAYFKCPLEFGFGDGFNSFYLPMSVMDRRLVGSSDELARLNDHMVVKYLAHRSKNDIVNRVKAAIIDGLSSGGVTEVSVAESLHMTSRNLHRRLQRENVTFKSVFAEIRKGLAQQYIQDPSLTLTEISFMLGFSEVSSFSRAYKSWTGVPPSEVRRKRA